MLNYVRFLKMAVVNRFLQ